MAKGSFMPIGHGEGLFSHITDLANCCWEAQSTIGKKVRGGLQELSAYEVTTFFGFSDAPHTTGSSPSHVSRSHGVARGLQGAMDAVKLASQLRRQAEHYMRKLSFSSTSSQVALSSVDDFSDDMSSESSGYDDESSKSSSSSNDDASSADRVMVGAYSKSREHRQSKLQAPVATTTFKLVEGKWSKEVIFEGWLSKRGPTQDYEWDRRWCVLYPCQLVYFADETCKARKGCINFGPSVRVHHVSHPNSPGDAIKHRSERPNAFVLDPDSLNGNRRRMFYFDTLSGYDLEAWSQAFNRAAQLQETMSLFQQFDLDGDGTITKTELTGVLRRSCPGIWTQKHITQLLADVDQDGTEGIQYEELAEVVANMNSVEFDDPGFGYTIRFEVYPGPQLIKFVDGLRHVGCSDDTSGIVTHLEWEFADNACGLLRDQFGCVDRVPAECLQRLRCLAEKAGVPHDIPDVFPNGAKCPAGHFLTSLGTSRDNGWACDARNDFGGCKSGITDFKQSSGMDRFRCQICDYDLCRRCFSERAGHATCRQGHTLLPRGKTSTPWVCDGRHGKCKTAKSPRFDCQICNYNLCGKCFDKCALESVERFRAFQSNLQCLSHIAEYTCVTSGNVDEEFASSEGYSIDEISPLVNVADLIDSTHVEQSLALWSKAIKFDRLKCSSLEVCVEICIALARIAFEIQSRCKVHQMETSLRTRQRKTTVGLMAFASLSGSEELATSKAQEKRTSAKKRPDMKRKSLKDLIIEKKIVGPGVGRKNDFHGVVKELMSSRKDTREAAIKDVSIPAMLALCFHGWKFCVVRTSHYDSVKGALQMFFRVGCRALIVSCLSAWLMFVNKCKATRTKSISAEYDYDSFNDRGVPMRLGDHHAKQSVGSNLLCCGRVYQNVEEREYICSISGGQCDACNSAQQRLRNAVPSNALDVIKTTDLSICDVDSTDVWKRCIKSQRFQVPPKLIVVAGYWKDQGWGNCKGQIQAKLMRGFEEVCCRDLFGVCRSDGKSGWQFVERWMGREEKLLFSARPGDFLEISYKVGGGGGHELHIQGMTCRIYWGSLKSGPDVTPLMAATSIATEPSGDDKQSSRDDSKASSKEVSLLLDATGHLGDMAKCMDQVIAWRTKAQHVKKAAAAQGLDQPALSGFCIELVDGTRLGKFLKRDGTSIDLLSDRDLEDQGTRWASLKHGEYITGIKGRSSGEGTFPARIELVLNTGRVIEFGSQDVGEADYSFTVESDQEIEHAIFSDGTCTAIAPVPLHRWSESHAEVVTANFQQAITSICRATMAVSLLMGPQQIKYALLQARQFNVLGMLEIHSALQNTVKISSNLPDHWRMSLMHARDTNAGHDVAPDDTQNLFGQEELNSEQLGTIQLCFNKSFRKIWTRDRKRTASTVPDGLSIVSGVRIQNYVNWRAFSARKNEIEGDLLRDITEPTCGKGHRLILSSMLKSSKLSHWSCDGRKMPNGCQSETGMLGTLLSKVGGTQDASVPHYRCVACDYKLCRMCYDELANHVPQTGVEDVKTATLTGAPEWELDKNSNCVWLFHGTDEEAAESIIDGSFALEISGGNAGSLYGRGIYFAESCSKADEYCEEGADGLRNMLICRVALGRVLYNDEVEPDKAKLVNQCVRGPYHSVLGDREKCRNTFREFIIYDRDQVYPEFLVKYRRRYG